MADEKWVNNVTGIDGGAGDGSQAHPWASIAYAAAQARSGQAITYVANTGTPYRDAAPTTNPILNLTANGGSAGAWAQWIIDPGTLILGTSAIPAGDWSRVPGYSYTWRTNIGSVTLMGVYARQAAISVFGIAPMKQITIGIPSDACHLHYYYDSVNHYLYVTLHDIDLAAGGVIIEIVKSGVNNDAIIKTATTGTDYVEINGGIWVGGVTYGMLLQGVRNKIRRAVLMPAGSDYPWRFTNDYNMMEYCLSYRPHKSGAYGHIRVIGAKTGMGAYNCVFVGEVYVASLNLATAVLTLNNCAFLDLQRLDGTSQPIFLNPAAGTINSQNNFIGVTRQGYFASGGNGYTELSLLDGSYDTAGAGIMRANDVGSFREITGCLLGTVAGTSATMTADHTAEAKSPGGTPFEVLVDNNQYMYICTASPVAGLFFELNRAGNYSSSLSWENLTYITTATWNSSSCAHGTMTGDHTYLAINNDYYLNVAESTDSLPLQVTIGKTGLPANANPQVLTVIGYCAGGNATHYINVEAYNYSTPGYEVIGTMPVATAKATYFYGLKPEHTSGGAMSIRFTHSSVAGDVGHSLKLDYMSAAYWTWAAMTSPAGTAAQLANSGNTKLTWTQAAAYYTGMLSLLYGGSIYTGYWIRVHAAGSVVQTAFVNQIRTLMLNGSISIRDKEGQDFRLWAGSPAIGSGTNLSLTEDFNGNPIVGNPDIGAYEFGRLNRINQYYRGRK
jgi:hypothetical protein